MLTVTKSGPGFVFSPNLIPTLAAKNVQCKIRIWSGLMWQVTMILFKGIHTSISKGTMKRNCHQDWLMGRCGRTQEAAGPAPKGSQENGHLFVLLTPSKLFIWKCLKVVYFSEIITFLIVCFQGAMDFAPIFTTLHSPTISIQLTTSSTVAQDAWQQTSPGFIKWVTWRQEKSKRNLFSILRNESLINIENYLAKSSVTSSHQLENVIPITTSLCPRLSSGSGG